MTKSETNEVVLKEKQAHFGNRSEFYEKLQEKHRIWREAKREERGNTAAKEESGWKERGVAMALKWKDEISKKRKWFTI